jgi:hypothetical protein
MTPNAPQGQRPDIAPMQPGARSLTPPGPPPQPPARPTAAPVQSSEPGSRIINVPTLGVSTAFSSSKTSAGDGGNREEKPPDPPPVQARIVGKDEIDGYGGAVVAGQKIDFDRPPIRPEGRSAPSRPLRAGDLECAQCGEANPSELQYCRRCGRHLHDAVVVRPKGWRKLLSSLLDSEEGEKGSIP